MSRIVILFCIIIYALLCLGYMKKELSSQMECQVVIYRLIFRLVLPVIGFILWWIVDYNQTQEKQQGLEDLYLTNLDTQDYKEYLNPINKIDEINKISMEEALTVNEYEVRRKMVMNTLQDETVMDCLEILKKALNNEDTETVHYASAIIMHAQNEMLKLVSQKESAYLKAPQDAHAISDWERCLEQIIFSGIYEDQNLYTYYERYKALSDNILKKTSIEEKYYFNRLKLDFKIGDLGHAAILSEKYKEAYPNSEDMVISYMKYCVVSGNKKKLKTFLAELKHLPVQLTQESLQYIRFLQV